MTLPLKSAGFNPLKYPGVFEQPWRLSGASAWIEHIPFAMGLVAMHSPRVLVELGTHHGDSYCAFCQAVRQLGLATRCHAVDTWSGDAQAGFYGEEVLRELRSHHDPLYATFSTLHQCRFDAAARRFPDGSIDLLHLDGCHGYEEVSHDYATWLPKLSRRGLILFHDTHVLLEDFGVHRVWNRVRRQFPHFWFEHGCGLGVLAVGPDQPEPVRQLLAATEDEAAAIRALFARLGAVLRLQGECREMRRRGESPAGGPAGGRIHRGRPR